MLAFIMFTESTSVLFHDVTKDAFDRVIPKLYSMGLWDVLNSVMGYKIIRQQIFTQK